MTTLWIASDPYKHRAMRINGVPETGITGSASDWQKFLYFAETCPKTFGNPVFHWTCMELKRFFDIDEILTADTAEDIWNRCNKLLSSNTFSTVSFLAKSKVETLCTSDDLLDDFQIHAAASAISGTTVLPSLRADTIVDFENPNFLVWLEKLKKLADKSCDDLKSFQEAIFQRLIDLDRAGCMFADHALDAGFCICRDF